ncbi:MAG: M23 family metallopeptidase [Spirochaetaceae bacterium]|jgi:murein DD-endopeptidase MepM/ murein hydrolase activator NlpD|nr:M23 family metallopeptidase [Spirochaetaceae bacterium]
MTAGLEKTIGQTALGFMQGTMTNIATSTINSVTYSSKKGFGFDGEAFGKSIQAGLVNSAVQATQTVTGGLINTGIEGLTGKALGDTSAMSNFVSGLAGQGVNAALGGDFTLNVLNLSDLTGGALNSGLLELRLGKKGMSMNIGTGGVNASLQNLVSVGQGIATYYDVNSKLANSRQEATGEFASQMRTLYSGTAEQRQAFDDALDNRLQLVKSGKTDFEDETEPGKRALAKTVDNGDGTRTMYIGTAAMEEGSRFGLNVVFGHEAYRNGKDDGEEGQRLETDRAVEGHISTANALMAGYGAGSVGTGFMLEAMEYNMAKASGNTEGMRKVLDRYDSSADYWKLTQDGGLAYDGEGWLKDENGMYINKDGSRSSSVRPDTIGASGVEGGLLNILGVNANDKTAVGLVQKLMTDAGIQHTDGETPADWQWRKSGRVNGETVNLTNVNMGKTIEFDAILAGGYGNSVNTAVFMNGFDKSTDAFAVGNTLAKMDEMNGTPDYVLNRYQTYASAKTKFYNSIQTLVGGATRISGLYGLEDESKTLYVNYGYRHYGIDIAAAEGTPVYAGISGVIDGDPVNHPREGNSVRIEYGYQFEGFTQTTGIIGEYLHLQSLPDVKKGDFVSANTQIEALGNTGSVSTGAHLHYDVFTKPGKSFSENVMANILGAGYMNGAMENKPPEGSSTKKVYDMTGFYEKYKEKYKK